MAKPGSKIRYIGQRRNYCRRQFQQRDLLHVQCYSKASSFLLYFIKFVKTSWLKHNEFQSIDIWRHLIEVNRCMLFHDNYRLRQPR